MLLPAARVSTIVARLRAAGCVFAEDETEILIASAEDHSQLESFVAERVEGVPLEYIVGWAEFCGLRIAVEPGVFVPRPRTEALVARASAGLEAGSVLVDLCCGSGAVGVALATLVSGIRVVAVDNDGRAVSVARRNLDPSAGSVYLGDLFEPVPSSLRGGVAVVTVVAPYVPTEELELLPREARDFEPRGSLDGGPDGLVVLERVIRELPDWLAADGMFVTEVSERQAGRVAQLVTAAGLHPVIETDEEIGTTLVVARRALP